MFFIPIGVFLGVLGVTLVGKAGYTGYKYVTAGENENTLKADLEGRLICFQNGTNSHLPQPLRNVDIELWSSSNTSLDSGEILSSATTNDTGHFRMNGEIKLDEKTNVFARMIISCSLQKEAPLYLCPDRLRMIADQPRFRDISCGNQNCSYIITSEILSSSPNGNNFNMSNFDMTKSKIVSVKVKCPMGEKPTFYDINLDSLEKFEPMTINPMVTSEK